MTAWMDGAMLIEAAVVSFLVALWITWMSLRGLFRMLPATKLEAVPSQSAQQLRTRVAGHDVA